MPQLVKGGKYVYSWSKINANGQIIIPGEAIEEYELMAWDSSILMPGSRTSGGFGLSTMNFLENSALATVAAKFRPLIESQVSEGEKIKINGKPHCWLKIQSNGSIIVPKEMLREYGANPGDWLLAAKGSHLAINFLVRGPIIQEAKKHLEIERFG